MRSIGIVLLIFGIIAIAGPGLRSDLVFLNGFPDQTLWIIGASLLAVGGVVIASTRRDD
jgi:hypothetical protein